MSSNDTGSGPSTPPSRHVYSSTNVGWPGTCTSAMAKSRYSTSSRTRGVVSDTVWRPPSAGVGSLNRSTGPAGVSSPAGSEVAVVEVLPGTVPVAGGESLAPAVPGSSLSRRRRCRGHQREHDHGRQAGGDDGAPAGRRRGGGRWVGRRGVLGRGTERGPGRGRRPRRGGDRGRTRGRRRGWGPRPGRRSHGRGRACRHACAGVERRPEGDRVLGVGVDRHRPSDPRRDQPGDERDAGRATDQEDRVHVLGPEPGRRHHAGQGVDGRAEQGPDELLELGPLEEDRVVHVAEPHRDRHRGLGGQRFLRVDAGAAELGCGDRRRRVVVGDVTEDGAIGAEGAQHVGEHGLVDVDAAQALDALGSTQRLEPPVGPAPEDGGVERAAPQVVHRDRSAGGEALGLRVPGRGGHRLGQQPGGGQVHQAQRLAQHVSLELAPVRGVGHGHRRGRATLGLGDRGGDPAEDLGQAPVDGHRRATEQERGRVADAPLELAGHPVGLLGRPPLGGVADQELAVVAQEHDRRHRRGAVPERRHLGAPAPGDAGGRVGGAEVDAQRVGHVRYCGSPRCPAKGRDRSASVGGR